MRRITVALLLGLALGCASQDHVEDALDDANYCDSPDDCIAIDPGCPFNCQTFINKAEKDDIDKLLARYHRRHDAVTCAYECYDYDGLDCIQDKCTAYANLDATP